MHLLNGNVVEERIDKNWGSPGNPMPDSAVADKFMGNVQGLDMHASAHTIVDVPDRLETYRAADLGQLLSVGHRDFQQ